MEQNRLANAALLLIRDNRLGTLPGSRSEEDQANDHRVLMEVVSKLGLRKEVYDNIVDSLNTLILLRGRHFRSTAQKGTEIGWQFGTKLACPHNAVRFWRWPERLEGSGLWNSKC